MKLDLRKVLHKTVLLRPLLALFGVKPKTAVSKAMDAAAIVDSALGDEQKKP